MSFPDKLRLLRKEKGLSQEELSEILNVSRQTISKWETGQAYPEIKKLRALSSIFNVSLDDLLNELELDEKINETIGESEASKDSEDGAKEEEFKHIKKLKLARAAWLVAGISFLFAFILNSSTNESLPLPALSGLISILSFINAYISHKKILRLKI